MCGLCQVVNDYKKVMWDLGYTIQSNALLINAVDYETGNITFKITYSIEYSDYLRDKLSKALGEGSDYLAVVMTSWHLLHTLIEFALDFWLKADYWFKKRWDEELLMSIKLMQLTWPLNSNNMAILILKPRHDSATILNVLLNLLGYNTSCIQLMWSYAKKYTTNSLLHVPAMPLIYTFKH